MKLSSLYKGAPFKPFTFTCTCTGGVLRHAGHVPPVRRGSITLVQQCMLVAVTVLAAKGLATLQLEAQQRHPARLHIGVEPPPARRPHLELQRLATIGGVGAV